MALLDVNNKKELEEYNDFIRNSEFGIATQDPSWSKVKSNWDSIFVYQRDENNKIKSAISILMIEALPGKIFAYAPRGPVVDLNDVKSFNDLIDEAIKYLPENTFLLRTDAEFNYDKDLSDEYSKNGYDVRNIGFESLHGTTQPIRTVMIDYSKFENLEDLMKSFRYNHRRAIKNFPKKNSTIQNGRSLELMNEFYDLYEQVAQRKGISYRNRQYFLDMQESFEDNGGFRISIAKDENGVPIASGIAFMYGRGVWYMYAGSNSDFNKLDGPYGVNWEMVKWGFENGAKRFNLGGVSEFTTDDGLYTYKRGYSPEDSSNITFIGEIDKVLDRESYEKFLNK